MSMPIVSRREWIWVMVIGTLVLLLATLPTLLGWAVSQPARQFGGFVFGLPDSFSYLAKMRLGADGAWLFSDVYAVEPHPPILLYLPYLLLGKLAGRSPAAILVVYHLARVMLGGILLAVSYRFVTLLLTEVQQRRLAWMLIAVGGGLGWLMIAVGQEPLPLGREPLDLGLGEAFSFIILFAVPHLALARSALLVGMMLYAQAVAREDWRLAAGAGMAWLVATIGVPFDILVAGGAVAGMLGARLLRTRRMPWRAVWLGLIAGLPGALWVLVNMLMIRDNPAYASWNAQNTLLRPHPLHFASAFGVPLALAVFGARRAWVERLPYADLFIGWALVSPLLTLIPVNVQLRLIEAFVLPLFALAVLGLDGLTHSLTSRRLASAALVGALLPSTLLLSIGGAAQPLIGSDYIFLSGDQVAGYAWLDAHAPAGSVLLASERVGLIAPSRASVRVVLGHGFETPYHARKAAEVAAFYGDGLSTAERRNLLEAYGVRYVWWGPDERTFGDFNPGTLPELAPVFAEGRVTIYEVRPRTGG